MLTGALVVACSACGDNNWLDVESSTSVQTDKVINVLSDVDFALNGVYSTMQDAYAYSGRLVYYGDVTGDDMQAYKASKRSGNAYMLDFTKDTSPSTYWSYPYQMIGECNVILTKIDVLKTDETELKDYYKGQALALRSLFLFDLTRIYGYPYKKDNGASLGVPLVTTVLDKNAKPERNTVAQCYAQIIKDLELAVQLMDNDEGNDYHKGHINRFGAMTLLSRIYLYHGDDQKALDMAKDAIKAAEAEGYVLWTNGEYPTAWSGDFSRSNKGEVLFEIVNTTEDSPGKESLGRLHHSSGYEDICVTSSFYDLLMQEPDDVRLKLLKFNKSKRALLYKYQPQEGEDIADANIPLLRLSEAYLNAAEAAVKRGNNDDAVKYLDAIVSRANPDKSVVGQTVTLDQVMTERRKELVGEGHRMYDALRDGGRVNRHDVKTHSEISSTKHLTAIKEKLNFGWDYYKCVLPIPKAEMDANASMKQNPSYDVAGEE